MKSIGWFLYGSFFVYIFPLFFSYAGILVSNPTVAQLSFIAGLAGWFIFDLLILKNKVVFSHKWLSAYRKIAAQGSSVTAAILRKSLLKERKNDTEEISIVVEFRNLAHTLVVQELSFVDQKPVKQRFDKGKTLQLKLNENGGLPTFVIVGAETKAPVLGGYLWILFNLAYMIVTFVLFFYYFGDSYSISFLSPWFPWVWTPWEGFLLFSLMGNLSKEGGFLSKKMRGKISLEEQSRLIVFGKKARAEVTEISPTGTTINDQPQIRFSLNFTDEKGQIHYKTFKKVVLLTDLYQQQIGSRQVLYLPENPNIFELV